MKRILILMLALLLCCAPKLRGYVPRNPEL